MRASLINADGAPFLQNRSVLAIGHPTTRQSFPWTVVRGSISNVSPQELLVDATLAPGNSGGPILNGASEVIGVVYQKKRGIPLGTAHPVWRVRDRLLDWKVLAESDLPTGVSSYRLGLIYISIIETRIRKEPDSIKSPLINTISCGEEVVVLEEITSKGYYRILESEGYVYKSELRRLELVQDDFDSLCKKSPGIPVTELHGNWVSLSEILRGGATRYGFRDSAIPDPDIPWDNLVNGQNQR